MALNPLIIAKKGYGHGATTIATKGYISNDFVATLAPPTLIQFKLFPILSLYKHHPLKISTDITCSLEIDSLVAGLLIEALFPDLSIMATNTTPSLTLRKVHPTLTVNGSAPDINIDEITPNIDTLDLSPTLDVADYKPDLDD